MLLAWDTDKQSGPHNCQAKGLEVSEPVVPGLTATDTTQGKS